MINAVYEKGQNGEVIFSWIYSLVMCSCLLFGLVLPKGQVTSVCTERDKENTTSKTNDVIYGD